MQLKQKTCKDHRIEVKREKKKQRKTFISGNHYAAKYKKHQKRVSKQRRWWISNYELFYVFMIVFMYIFIY